MYAIHIPPSNVNRFQKRRDLDTSLKTSLHATLSKLQGDPAHEQPARQPCSPHTHNQKTDLQKRLPSQHPYTTNKAKLSAHNRSRASWPRSSYGMKGKHPRHRSGRHRGHQPVFFKPTPRGTPEAHTQGAEVEDAITDVHSK